MRGINLPPLGKDDAVTEAAPFLLVIRWCSHQVHAQGRRTHPTFRRLTALAATLACLLGQRFQAFSLHVSDQTHPSYLDHPTVEAILRVHRARGRQVQTYAHAPPRGIAEHRHFLLSRARAPYVLFMDDDVLLEPWVLEHLVEVIEQEACGFVGAFPAGLSFENDVRPHQQQLEFWEGPVQPELVEPGSPAWERRHLHRAANIWHAGLDLRGRTPRRHKVAWIAQCVLYDRAKLLQVGGFDFWPRLPRYHSGEDVLVQVLLQRRFGGCGIIPSGTYHQEVRTSVLNRQGKVDGHALALLPELLRQQARDATSEVSAQARDPGSVRA